jgi:hypothetical protein
VIQERRENVFLSLSAFLSITTSPYAQNQINIPINKQPSSLQSPLKLGKFHACLVTAAAAALLKPHPSPSS